MYLFKRRRVLIAVCREFQFSELDFTTTKRTLAYVDTAGIKLSIAVCTIVVHIAPALLGNT